MGPLAWTADVLARARAPLPPWVRTGIVLFFACLITYIAVREIRAWRRHRRFSRGGLVARRKYRVLVEAAVRGGVAVSGAGRCAIGFAAAPKSVQSFQLDRTRSTPDGEA